jgi:hydroxymethylbilane synthase
LGLADRIRTRFSAAQMLPAAGQGALGIEVRANDTPLRDALAALIHRPTWLAVHAERAVSRGLGGSCSMPLAAHAQWQGHTLHLAAALGHSGEPTRPMLVAQVRDAVADESGAETLGAQAVVALHAAGARDYL